MPTPLATQVRNIFEKFARAAAQSTPSQPISVLACWRTVLGPGQQGTPQVLEGLALVDTALERLSGQIDLSPALDDDAKTEARRLIDGFKQCTAPQAHHRNAHEFMDRLGPDRLGMIRFLATTLVLDVPPPDAGAVEQDAIAARIDELMSMIAGAHCLSPRSKALLTRHASFMAWALRNPDIVGSEGVRGVVARTLISVPRMSADDGGHAAMPSPGSAILKKMLSLGGTGLQ